MTMWDDSGSDEDEMDPEEHSRMEVLCRAFEDLCHQHVPAPPGMAAGAPRFDREGGVQEQHALLRP